MDSLSVLKGNDPERSAITRWIQAISIPGCFWRTTSRKYAVVFTRTKHRIGIEARGALLGSHWQGQQVIHHRPCRQKRGLRPFNHSGGIERDSACSRKVLAPGEWTWAVVAKGVLSWTGPHDLQPWKRSGLSPCALPAKLPGLLGH
jgi:hypothetical protein